MTGSMIKPHAAEDARRTAEAQPAPERPRRAILTLKNPPLRLLPPSRWKCKPCGAALEVAADRDPADTVRCPNCNARLGLAGDFQNEGATGRVRARKA